MGAIGQEVDAMESLVLEFHQWDPTSQGFRYYRARGGKKLLEGRGPSVDLDNLASAAGRVFDFLDTAEFGMGCELDLLDEHRASRGE